MNVPLINNLQCANWSEKFFRQMREGDVDAVHVTIAYHESFLEAVLQVEAWNRWFEQYPDLIMRGILASDVAKAQETERTAIFFGFQNPSPVENDIGLTRYGAQNIGIGTDFCQDQPESIVEWMRVGPWSKVIDYREGSASKAGFADMPSWFADNHDFGAISGWRAKAGFARSEVDGIMVGNWMRSCETSFGPAT